MDTTMNPATTTAERRAVHADAADKPVKATSVRRGQMTLGDAQREFWSHATPWMIGAVTALAIAARVWLGAVSWWDLAVVALLVCLQPIQEWFIHVHILHFRPRTIFGLRIDPTLGRVHRAHHVDPWRVDLIFVPKFAVPLSASIHALVWGALLPLPLAATAMVTAGLLGLHYEWVHYIAHIPYRPKLRWYRENARLHRLHHFKNENYWQGVSGFLGDRIMRTLPDPKDVPKSKTVRDLHGQDGVVPAGF